jgi:hypothetical protein
MTGHRQAIEEATITAEYRLSKTALARVEYRRDWGDLHNFEKGTSLVRSQATVLGGIVMTFGVPVR